MEFEAWKKDVDRYFAEEIELHQPQEDDEFTAIELREYLQEANVALSEKSAATWMNKAIKNGDVTSRLSLCNGRRTRLFRFEPRTSTPES